VNKPSVRALALAGSLAALVAGVPSGASAVSADRAAPNQRFVLLLTNPTDGGGTVVGFGQIHAAGTDVAVSSTKDRFKFPDGNLVIKHKITPGSVHERFDEATCYFKFTERGTWEITKGTRAYADAVGEGTYRLVGHGVGCEENRPPEVFTATVKARGNVSY
jgi:hypothetical protein